MTLFESTIRKLNIPKCVIDDIVAIRNICMEAEQPQQPAQKQATNPAQQQQQKPTQPQQPANQQQNAAQAQPQQNANLQTGTQQGQPQAQGNAQQQPRQNAKEVPQNIEENQVDANKLMEAFNNYLSGCQKKFTQMLESKFGQDAQTAINNVKQYVESNSKIDFNNEVAPFLTVNGKPITDPKVIDGIRNNFKKYFGATFVSDKPEAKPQEQTKQQSKQQEQAQVQTQEQAQPQQ